MDTKINSVDYLRKITVSLEMGTSAEEMDLSSASSEFQFIYGVGTQGICLFEKALFGKQPGEAVVLPVEITNVKDFFGHLLPSIRPILPPASFFYLKSNLIAVDLVENREVVQAIADGRGLCACDCGCGCD